MMLTCLNVIVIIPYVLHILGKFIRYVEPNDLVHVFIHHSDSTSLLEVNRQARVSSMVEIIVFYIIYAYSIVKLFVYIFQLITGE